MIEMSTLKFVNKINKAFENHPKTGKVVGALLVLVGIILHLIPLFPAGWIIVLGLELLGVRLLFWNKIKAWSKIKNKNNNI